MVARSAPERSMLPVEENLGGAYTIVDFLIRFWLAVRRGSRSPSMLRATSSVFLLALFVNRATCQELSPGGRLRGATVTGVAIDSLHDDYLAGASVSVSGTTLSATTDSVGEFRIAGIPAGNHSLRIQHPLLDSLAISITTRERFFKEGDSTFVLVGVPSAESLVASTCSNDDRERGPAFVVGTVTDAESGAPSTGALVTVDWTDYEIGKNSIKRTPQHRLVEVSATGRFRMCGLPQDFIASVVAFRGSDSTATLETNLSSLVGILSFHLPPPRAAAQARGGDSARTTRATFISGRVVDQQGKPSSGATVAIEADSAIATTAEDGTFTLSALRPGTRTVSVRKIGYEPARAAVELKSGEARRMDLTLGQSVTLLKAMIITAARANGLVSVGFADRKIHQNGEFLGPEELKFRDLHHLGNILRTVPRMSRGDRCVKYYVDGMLVMQGASPEDYLGGLEIGAIEVYSSLFVPGKFLAISTLGEPCAAVIVWTKWSLGML